MLLPAVLLNDSSSLTFRCVWRGWIYSVYLSWPQSRLPCVFWKLWRIIFNIWLLTVYMYLGFCFHNFVLFIILLSIFSFWEKLLENCFLLAAIFHMEHNINFVFHSCNLCQDGNSLYIILFITSLNCRDSSLLEAKLCMCAQSLSCVWLFVTPGTVARQASLSIGLSWQEYWSGLPFSPPEDLLNSGIQPAFPVTPALRWIPYHWAIGESPKIINDSPSKLHQ